MTDKEFDNLMKKSMEQYGSEYIDEKDINTTSHEFSPEFEKKMAKLINSMDKPKRNRFNIALKRFAVVASCLFVVLSVTVMSVDALREKVFGFIIKDYGKDSIIQIDVNDSAPRKIEAIYAITYDLSDYEITYEDNNDVHRITNYQNGDSFVNFAQELYENFNKFYSTEGAEILNIEFEECEATYFKSNHGDDVLIWNNDDYVFSIMTNLGYDELLEIAYSVQVIE